MKKFCTKLNKRIIHRSEFQGAVDKNNANIRNHPDYYKRRQSICEHPFGTIKRQWGYTYTLMKGLQKVNGEMNLIMLVYNIKRTMAILGFDKMMQAIENWKPDYKAVICALKKLITKMIFRQNETSIFLTPHPSLYSKAISIAPAMMMKQLYR